MCLTQICGQRHLNTSQTSLLHQIRAQETVLKPLQAQKKPIIEPAYHNLEPEVLGQNTPLFLPPWFFKAIKRLISRHSRTYVSNHLTLALFSAQKGTTSQEKGLETILLMVLALPLPQDNFSQGIHLQAPPAHQTHLKTQNFPTLTLKIPTIPILTTILGSLLALVPQLSQVPTSVPSTVPEK